MCHASRYSNIDACLHVLRAQFSRFLCAELHISVISASNNCQHRESTRLSFQLIVATSTSLEVALPLTHLAMSLHRFDSQSYSTSSSTLASVDSNRIARVNCFRLVSSNPETYFLPLSNLLPLSRPSIGRARLF